MKKTQRIRDPVHDLIVFREESSLDDAAWKLVQTPDFQRLRRIKQLGFSEYTFPSATHTRFSHSLGVFDVARRLINLLKREIELKRVQGQFDEPKANVAVVAALLHDLGHGPFSHAFEEARKAIARRRNKGQAVRIEKHETFSSKMIADANGPIRAILNEAKISVDDIAALISAETPGDMYHAVVSSSFDADRLDYLQRDRYMTGTGVGAIDLGWLMDNIRVASIDVSPAGGEDGSPVYTHSFCLNYKARDAAEDFLLARYRLYANVYFHKATRGFEQLASLLFRLLAEQIEAGATPDGLYLEHPICQFFRDGGDSLQNYRLLDDMVVWGAIHDLARGGSAPIKDIALRILLRNKLEYVDVQLEFPEHPEKQRRLKHELDRAFVDKLEKTVLRDTAALSLYGEVGADDSRAQKRLMILQPDGEPKEITLFGDATVRGSERSRPFERYYFLDQSDRAKADGLINNVRERRK